MPKKEMNFKKTIMYKIVCDDLEVKDVYVGHTINFDKRKWAHSAMVKKTKKDYWENRSVYKKILEHGGWDNWSMIKIEDYPCESKLDAEMRERFWIEELKANLNMNKPRLTLEENNDCLITCECGHQHRYSQTKFHLQSKKHKE